MSEVWQLKVSGDLQLLYNALLKQTYEDEGIIIAHTAIMRVAVKNYLLELLKGHKDYKELVKVAKFNEERIKERIRLAMSKDIIKRNTYLSYVFNYYKKKVINQPISQRRKTIIMNQFLETGKRYGYSKKQVLKVIEKAGHKVSFEIQER